eukprot:CAMPEP_0174376146 /NCGR_PEP_ID=MMETSP0811_2-20130205/117149_1 /TAXON_ID=73025 ORGANISM="Eutreptiella gymnastica-like, Strain CCMP1594" /NCGR_SAMPLE_ID=MMETSP0811_2 /ASSEMBLY_ACC=CAM_ASM_000667 /LENGTH=68 /DNA_ID=CAMNT_0015527045 /DNA_START=488 /DNA_END=691 /DNA_ORIENTATION=-
MPGVTLAANPARTKEAHPVWPAMRPLDAAGSGGPLKRRRVVGRRQTGTGGNRKHPTLHTTEVLTNGEG